MIKLESIIDKINLMELLQKDNIFLNILGNNDLEELKKCDLKGWFIVTENSDQIGLIQIKHFSGKCFLFHGGIYKAFRGNNSERYLKEILTELKQIAKDIIFLASVNKQNKLAIKYLLKAGFEECLIIPNGSLNNQDLSLFIEKERNING